MPVLREGKSGGVSERDQREGGEKGKEENVENVLGARRLGAVGGSRNELAAAVKRGQGKSAVNVRMGWKRGEGIKGKRLRV
jgi:hypothetical protein